MQYMPPSTASIFETTLHLPNGTLSEISTNSYESAAIIPCDNTDMIIFSHGYSVSRSLYTTLSEDRASHGYLVIAIGHPYDASAVELPHGRVAFIDPMRDMDPDVLLGLLDVRVKDTVFTFDFLNTNLTRSIPGVRKRLRINGIGMYGHSFGGATTAAAMLVDQRIHRGMDMDGDIFGAVVERGLGKPFVLMGVPGHSLSSEPMWRRLWEGLRGRWGLVLDGAAHVTFSDLGVVFSLLGLKPAQDVAPLLRTIEPGRACEVVRVYVREFFYVLLRGGPGVRYDGPYVEYPEVLFEYGG